MPIRDDLIRVYASTDVKDIGTSQEYRDLRDAQIDNNAFDRDRNIVEPAKRRIEVVVGGSKNGIRGQVRAAIWELRRWRRHEDRDPYHDLIAATYRNRDNSWSDTQKAHFDKAWALIQYDYDFFLSFTTRFAKVAGHNPVNVKYEHLIRRVVSDDVYDEADKRKMNLLAAAIHKLLSEPPRKGFFFPHSQGNNEDVDRKLAAACGRSAVFVQVLQNILFVVPEAETPGQSRTNYCFWEYGKALQGFGGLADPRAHILLVGAEDARTNLVKEYDVPAEYDEWYTHASSNDVPYLESLHKFDPNKVEALRQLVLTKVLPRVDEVWDRLLDTVPAR